MTPLLEVSDVRISYRPRRGLVSRLVRALRSDTTEPVPKSSSGVTVSCRKMTARAVPNKGLVDWTVLVTLAPRRATPW